MKEELDRESQQEGSLSGKAEQKGKQREDPPDSTSLRLRASVHDAFPEHMFPTLSEVTECDLADATPAPWRKGELSRVDDEEDGNNESDIQLDFGHPEQL